jgi:topoisomerase-4 subunit A
MNLVKGPDFPTGGIVEGKSGLEEAYKTGKGKVILKGKTYFEKVKGKDVLVISEIPYEVNKALLVRQIDDIRVNKKIDGIMEVRDESDREGLRVAIDLKKDANQELILNYLLKNTQLQVSFNFNVIAIVSRRPKQLGILDILDAYIAHQKEIVTKRSRFDLEHAKERYHIVEGFLKAMSILDEVIKVIRKSKNKQDAQENLTKEFEFSPLQAEAIVMLQLYRLTNTDVVALEEELKNLTIIINGLNAILTEESKLLDAIKNELRRIKREYGTPRKTQIVEEYSEIKIDTTLMIQKEDVVVVVTKDGYVKRVSYKSYSASKEEETSLKEGDYVIGIYEMNTLNTILLFTSLGNYLYLPVYEVPDMKWKELGKHISNIIPLKEGENIVGSMPVYDFNKEIYVTTFTNLGMIKRTKLSEYEVQRYSKTMSNMKIKDTDRVIGISYNDAQEIVIVTDSGYSLRFDIGEVSITGIRTSGVKTINLKNDKVISGLLPSLEYLTLIMEKGNCKRIKVVDIEKMSRSRRGISIAKIAKSKPQKIVSVLETSSKDIIGLKIKNNINMIKNSEIPIMDLQSIGSSIVKDNIEDAFVYSSINKEEIIEERKEVSLEEIDDKILTIDTFLKELE